MTTSTRDIDTLLHMDSYQNMSDEEIEAVISRREELARQEGIDSVSQDLYKSMEELSLIHI